MGYLAERMGPGNREQAQILPGPAFPEFTITHKVAGELASSTKVRPHQTIRHGLA
jgi:hypothetical protein